MAATAAPDGLLDPMAATAAIEGTPGPLARTDLAIAGTGAAAWRKHGGAGNLRLAPGATLAHFRVESLLGKGGMGEVYLATDTALDRPVAIKLLPRAIAGDRALRERFLREARAQARLQHPHICHIYFVGEDQGQLFFAMEYVDGESLQDRLDRGAPIPADRAIELCRMAALALREAHQQGFTHRDIKPSNLMIDRHDAIKVVDFGLVKQLSEATCAPVDGPAHDTAAHHTAAHHTAAHHTAIVGTPLYMAPEQARGRAADFRSDIYALGTTLHHLVAGKPPFAGDSADALMRQHESAERPRLLSDKREPSPVDVLCDRMMAKRPEDRFASYDELIHAMERLSPAHTAPAGLWVRGFALGVDLLVVALLAPLAFMLPGTPNIWALTLFGVYAVLGHGRFGRTLGKSLLEIEVLPFLQAGQLGYRRAMVRFLVQWGPLLALGWLRAAAPVPGDHSIRIVLGVLGALAAAMLFLGGLLTMLRSPGKRAYWDRIAGTQVCYRRNR